jgi:D-beta-D-heptose 7-phosphate kinase/D-beta-D-heptose 1-phosphate adenosyltransferase
MIRPPTDAAETPQALADVLERFAAQQLLVVGDVMLDEYVTGDCARLSPEAPVPVVAVGASRSTLGGAANTAANIASLGGRAVLVGLIGDDEVGRQLSARARELGIFFVPIQDGRPTARKVRVVGQQQQLLRLDYETTSAIGADVEARVLHSISAHLPASAAVVISDYAKGLLTHSLCQRIIQHAHAAGRPVIIDPRPQNAAFYTGADYLTPNWKESLGLAGEPEIAATAETIAQVGARLAGRSHSHVLLTLGPRGMAFFDRDGRLAFEEPALAREVFDVSGAGDTVVATFALALAAGQEHRAAVALANRAAGIVVGKLGTATITPREMLRTWDRERAIVSRADLAGLAARLRHQGQRLVTINGAFDLLHAGHLHILREARRQGDVLIVGVNADATVRAGKGPNRPYVGEQDRARLLLALRDVDYVHIFPEPVPMPFLEQIRPDVHVNGSEYGADCIEAPTIRAGGGRLHIVERLPHLSTSELVARIQGRSPAAAVDGSRTGPAGARPGAI